MSWGAGADGASAAGGGASAAGAGSGAGITSQIADVGGTSSTPATTGFTIEPAQSSTGAGPTVDAANMDTYGTKDPSIMQRGMNKLERFQKGEGNNMSQFYDKFGNNPETYGYAYNKLGQLSAMGKGGGGGAAPITTNISYQQPQNDYLNKRRY